MANSQTSPGVQSGRLDQETLARNFSDLHPKLGDHEALVASDRCYFCHDAPCQTACPTDIDIPLFIRQIATGRPNAAAITILNQNILGGMCARVCPTETLCEQACVREAAEGKPVLIGQLQRYATDGLMETGVHPFSRAAETGKHVAVVGAGPAGLACAHRLAMHGHNVTILEARTKAGGLNEYGIASYKTVDDFAQAELDWLLKIGGIHVENGKALGRDVSLASLRADYDAVFLGCGLGQTNDLGLDRTVDAIDFIADLRQADDLQGLPIGRHVVVIGGGMTAVDAAVQAKLLGAQNVTIAYRRGQDAMSASRYEQDLATSKGVHLLCNAVPKARVDATITLALTETRDGQLVETGETVELPADQVFAAIGQKMDAVSDALKHESGKIWVDDRGATSLSGVWAGGDCAVGGDDLTVTAVAEGRDAAEHIHAYLIA